MRPVAVEVVQPPVGAALPPLSKGQVPRARVQCPQMGLLCPRPDLRRPPEEEQPMEVLAKVGVSYVGQIFPVFC